jgi:hypothetical protein
MLKSKINFKKKQYCLNLFLSKKHLKINVITILNMKLLKWNNFVLSMGFMFVFELKFIVKDKKNMLMRRK